LDVLVVYDTLKLTAETVRNDLQEFFADLASATGLKVHAVLLSQSEENQAEFIAAEEAIPLELFWTGPLCTKRQSYQNR